MAKPVSSTWHFRASEFIRGTGPRNLWLVFGFLILGMTITALASLYVKSEVERAAEREFDFISSEIQHNIADRLAASAQVLFSGAALLESSGTVTREEWHIFIEQLRIEEQLPGIQGVGFALLIPPEQLDQHIQQIRDEGFPQYTVRPEGDRGIYSSIIYLEPFTGRNLRAFGYDMFSEPVRRAAMEQARDENTAVLSGKVTLVQETNEDVQAGTLMYVPIYRKGLPIETVEQRRAAIIGWVYSPYRMTDLMRGTLRNWEAQQGSEHYHLHVYDGDVISTDNLLFDSRSEADKALAASTPEFSRLTPVDFEGHHWTLRFSQMGGLSTLADYDSFWFILSGGTSFTIILAGLALSVLRTQVNAQRIAKELTIELKESEEKYSIIFNNEVYAICIFDLETLQLLDVNKAYEQVYGYSREELLNGMTIHDITAEHQASSEATVKAVNDGTTFIPLRYHRKKDGTVFPVEIVGGPYVWRNRKVMFALAHDITDRKKDEQEIRKLGRAVEQSPASIVITGVDGSIEYVNPKFTEITGYTLAEAAGGNPRILKSGYTTEQGYRLLWDTITSGDQWQGEFQNKKKNGELYWEKAMIAPVWNDLGQITNFLAIKEDITQRKMMEDAIRASEQKYRLLFETLNEGVALNEIVYDENGEMIDYRVMEVNEAFYLTADYSGPVIGALATKVYGMSLETIQAFWHEHKDRKTVQLTEFSSPLNGRHFIISTSPFIHDRFVTSFFDITDRKRAEDALRASELGLKRAQAVSQLGNWELDLSADTLTWSDEIYNLFEIDRGQIEPSYEGFLNVIHPHDRALVNDKYQNSLKTREPYHVDHRLLMPDGRVKWVHEACDTDFDAQGNPLISRGTIQDITERKQMEDALRHAHWRAESILEGTQAGTWEWNIQSGETAFNQKWAQIIGYTLDELAPVSIKTWEKFSHPEDLKQSGELLERHFAGELPNYEFESRMKHKDGRWVWVLDRGRVITRTSDGKPLMMFGTHQDITERKQMEIDLQAQRDFATQIVNVMGQGLTVTDADGRFEFVNPAYARLFGYVPADLIGRRPVDISLPEENAVLSEQRKRRMKGQVSTYESRLIRTDGSIAHVLITGAPREIDGKYAGAIAVITDLTEQKQVENKLRASEEKYRTVANFTYDWEAWRAPDGTYLYNSPSCEQISGHSASEFNTNPDLMLEITHPDDQPILIEHQRAAGGELKDQDLEIDFRIITPGGETRWIAHSCTTVYSEDKHWLGRRESNRDITDRKRKEELLFESENRYRRLFETAKDGILIVDAESGMIKDVNPFLIELLGYSREQFIDRELWELGFFKDIVANQDNFLELQQKQYIRYENLPLETFDGRKVNVEFISNVYLVDNKKVIQCNIRDITARRKAEEKIRLLNAELEALAGTDGLTGINNHRSLLKLSEREFEVAMRYQPPLSMMFFDIDHFKQINDTFGHAIGDEALKLTVETVCAKLRSADLIGRYGGDEFVILLPQTSALDALPLAERIHAGIADMRLDTNKGPLTLTISIGIAQSIHGASEHDTVESLLLRADQALYAAKQAGRNRTVIFDDRLS
ncbi:MAG: PAS domain S-box protein [Anaerolineales bacterium]|nr:PAS domain S-box protein [Anaerolineales bacterium]